MCREKGSSSRLRERERPLSGISADAVRRYPGTRNLRKKGLRLMHSSVVSPTKNGKATTRRSLRRLATLHPHQEAESYSG